MMQRYEISIQQPWNTHATEHGEWVKFTDANATIARLTAERDEARAEAAAAYERAAQVADHYSDADYCDMGYPEEGGIAASGTADAIRRDIRALATDPGTTALAEMLDAETRACAQIVREKRAGLVGIGVERAILARIDQRKEVGE